MSNIIITGANEGIGYYLVRKLLQDGHNVGVLDVDIANIEIKNAIWGDPFM